MTKPQLAPWDAFKDPDLTELEKELISDLAAAKLDWEKLSNERDDLRALLNLASWLIEHARGVGEYGLGEEWLAKYAEWKERVGGMSGHTPTITPGQYASLSREQLESALSEREDQLRRALAELEELKKGVRE